MRVEHRNSQTIFFQILFRRGYSLINERPSFTKLLLLFNVYEDNLTPVYFHFINIIREMIATERGTQLLQNNSLQLKCVHFFEINFSMK